MGQGEFLWFDLACSDLTVAQDFYGPLMGWQFRDHGFRGAPNYKFAQIDGEDVAGLYPMPEPATAQGFAPFWMSYIGVDNVAETIKAAQRLGGQALDGPARFADGSAVALLADPDGAVFSIFEGKRLFPMPHAPRSGHPFRAILHSTDLARAERFYHDLFGWRMVRGPDRETVILQDLAGAQIGAMTAPPTGADLRPEHRWQVLFAPPGGDEAARQVGATRHLLGSWQVQDPSGAPFMMAAPQGRRWP